MSEEISLVEQFEILKDSLKKRSMRSITLKSRDDSSHRTTKLVVIVSPNKVNINLDYEDNGSKGVVYIWEAREEGYPNIKEYRGSVLKMWELLSHRFKDTPIKFFKIYGPKFGKEVN